MKNKNSPSQARKASAPSLEQVFERLAGALRHDRKIRFVKTMLWAVAGIGAGVAVASLWAVASPLALGAAGGVAVGIPAAVILWRAAPNLHAMARLADRYLGQDVAIETAVESALKSAPTTNLTLMLHEQVDQATRGLVAQQMIPWRLGAPVTGAIIGIGLAVAAPFASQVPVVSPQATLSTEDVSSMLDSLAAIAALRDSSNPALAALARDAEALAMQIAADPTMSLADIAEVIADLHRDAALVLGLATDEPVTPESLARIATALAEEPAPLPTELPDETTPIAPTGDPDTGPQEQNIDAPENNLVSMPTQSIEDAIMNDDLACVFGDEPTCEVRADGAPPPAPETSLNEDMPEQIGRDELTEGGDPAQTSQTATGDAGATGTATAALYGTAELTEAGEAAFGVETLTLGAENAIGEGRRNQIDIPTTFDGVSATRFPDAPIIGQDGWQRQAEAPVARPAADTALNRAMTEYYRAPEDWR